MSNKSKKIFPKIKKKLKGFLADESGKITKKDAMGLSAAGLLLGTEEVVGGYVQVYTSLGSGDYYRNPPICHASGVINGHFSGSNFSSSVSPTYSGTTYSHSNTFCNDTDYTHSSSLPSHSNDCGVWSG